MGVLATKSGEEAADSMVDDIQLDVDLSLSEKNAMTLPEGCIYHAMISHFQRTGGDQAMCLCLALKDELKWSCWYDQNVDVITLEGMREGIENSAVFVLFLTQGVLTRPFVQFEIRTALHAKKPFIILHEEDTRHDAFNFAEFKEAPTFLMSQVGAIIDEEEGENEFILTRLELKAISASVESLAWRRRGYERTSLLEELGRRYITRERFIPDLSMLSESSRKTSVTNGTNSACESPRPERTPSLVDSPKDFSNPIQPGHVSREPSSEVRKPLICQIPETKNGLMVDTKKCEKWARGDHETIQCVHCKLHFCSYHYDVNNSTMPWSFGGHVCPVKKDTKTTSAVSTCC